jgi:hypothetical protein
MQKLTLTINEANGKRAPKRGPYAKGTCTDSAILPTTQRGIRRRKAAMAGYVPEVDKDSPAFSQ